MTNTFLGYRMAQSTDAIPAWEKVLAKYPFKRILEIGTYRGGFATYLSLYCFAVGAEFATFDIKDLRENNSFDKSFHLADCFAEQDKIKAFLSQEGRSILFCDGGKKEKEFNTFVDSLKIGDIIAVHDWNTEVFARNLKLDGLAYINGLDSMTQFFIKNA